MLWQVQAQKQIAVQNGGNAAFYAHLDSALYYAQNGDTLYLPGGIYTMDTLFIDKPIHLVGVGHHPDSSIATGRTRLNGDVRILTGADNGSITGFYIYGSVYFGTNSDNQDVNTYLIDRCYIRGFYNSSYSLNLSYRNNGHSNCRNIMIRGSVIFLRLNGGFSHNAILYNNMISHQVSNFSNNSYFSNNIFFYNHISRLFSSLSYSTLKNNIFLCSAGYFGTSITGCEFFNNLFTFSESPSSLPRNNEYYKSISDQEPSSIFVQQNGSFSYTDDYHLQPTSAGKNGGTDGTDVGVYGGIYPWKEGSIPFHPHIQSNVISSSTDRQGRLNVKIRVKAQDY